MLAPFYRLLRPLLFALDAERAHDLTFAVLRRAPRFLGLLLGRGRRPTPGLARRLGPLSIAGPVGLAAGLDKDGQAIPFWPALGFGFVEVGTVTAHAQPGNPRPRLFRLPADRALINRFGFNNQGSAALAERLRRLKGAGAWPQVPVGVNLGKSKVTPVEAAAEDYVTSVERLVGLADYFTVNVSSPNTPGLRALQEKEALAGLLGPVVEAAAGTPLFLKLAPDLEREAIAEAVEVAISSGISGLIATNTTITRSGLRADPGEAGGLSGRPLWPLARKKIEEVLEASAGRLPVVGVGGIERADQVRELLEVGCAAVQIYTALIYQGPSLPARLHADLVAG
ncbi:MAG TPA: quinone-dependent dihydroorotate dehydrogenase [Thermoanaerobaculia bacterium]|nr:quinone-dependent dihydroorotate dehydrogenase [Thermoanaerobaculia bacterium]